MKFDGPLRATGSAIAVPGLTDRPASRRGIRIGVYALLLTGDVTIIVASFLVADLLRFGDATDPAGLTSLALILPIYLGIAVQRKPYSARFFTDWRRTGRDVLSALVTAMAVAAFIAVYLHASTETSRSVIPIGGAVAGVLLLAMRRIVHHYSMAATHGNAITTLLILDDVAAPAGTTVPTIDAGTMGIRPDPNDPHALDRLSWAIARSERVVVACPSDHREAWAAALKGANVQGEIILPDLARIGTIRASSFAGSATAVVSLGPLDTLNRIIKRCFDLAVALSALALLWPVLVGVAIAIQIDSAGPVLFRQERMGRGNRLFAICKFRSMRTDSCDATGDRSTARGDPRITRVGRLIRATSIDELPQLLNVVRGDMSIVGPRPHALGSLAGDRLFWEVDGHYWDRHAIKPGITGLAQVHGFRGATAVPEDLANRLQSDLAYMSRWTIWRDLRILVATVRVLVHRNAF